MKTFKRENKYLVFKLKDLNGIPEQLHQALMETCEFHDQSRRERGQPVLETVVVESRYPYYETVWKLIEDYANRRNQS